MSYFLLSSELDTHAVTIERKYSWSVFAGVEETFTFVWDILETVSGTFITKWSILQNVYAVGTIYIKWSISVYVERSFSYVWDVATRIGTKIKYTFSAAKLKSRIFRRDRIG